MQTNASDSFSPSTTLCKVANVNKPKVTKSAPPNQSYLDNRHYAGGRHYGQLFPTSRTGKYNDRNMK